MTYKAFLSTIIAGTIISWAGLYLILMNTDPITTESALFLFFSTLFLALFGTFTSLGLVARSIFLTKKYATMHHFKQSIRQSFLLSIVTLLSLYLLANNLFVWWLAIIMLFVIILFETAIYSLRTSRSGYVQ